MSLRLPWALLLNAAAVVTLFHQSATAYGQTTPGAASQPLKPVSIPFVGCPSLGQIGELEAPTGASVTVPLTQREDEALAYYKSANGIAVLAPRGWYCQGASGSGGAALFLGPRPIVHSASGWEGLNGAAIEVNDISGENGGRYEIAEIVARVFPAYRPFARRVWVLNSPFPAGPFPRDTLTYRSNAVVEYTTPAQTNGLGNFNSWLGKNDLPIAGVAILLSYPPRPDGNVPHLLLLSVRLAPDSSRLAPAIVRYLERNAVN